MSSKTHRTETLQVVKFFASALLNSTNPSVLHSTIPPLFSNRLPLLMFFCVGRTIGMTNGFFAFLPLLLMVILRETATVIASDTSCRTDE